MTKLLTTYQFGSNCYITLSNTTGFNPESPDGFLKNSVVIDLNSTDHSKSFKLSEVYFFNAVIYNPYGKDQTIENVINGEVESPIKVTEDVNFPKDVNKTYSLNIDGYYIIGQLIALDKSYYDANKTSTRFTGNKYIVYDSVNKTLQYANNGVYTTLTLIELFDDKLVDVDFMRSYHKVVSTTKLYNCYMSQMEQYINSILSNCNKGFDYNNILVLYMTFEAIKYRINLCEYNYAQKYIEWINSCTNICNTNTNVSTCGCNG